FVPYNFNSSLIFTDDGYKAFKDWQSVYGNDINGSLSIDVLSSSETEQLFYNDTKQPKTFNLNTSVFKDIYGKEVTGKFTLEPFTSIILIGKDFSGINQNPEIPDQSFHLISPVNVNEFI